MTYVCAAIVSKEGSYSSQVTAVTWLWIILHTASHPPVILSVVYELLLFINIMYDVGCFPLAVFTIVSLHGVFLF